MHLFKYLNYTFCIIVNENKNSNSNRCNIIGLNILDRTVVENPNEEVEIRFPTHSYIVPW